MLENLPRTIGVILSGSIIGFGATAMMDIWGKFLKVVFRVSGLDLAVLGRWIGYMLEGKLVHTNPTIFASPPVYGESSVGLLAHYCIGSMFGMLLLCWRGTHWLESPSIVPAIVVGLATMVFPLFLMWPCFGLGVAACQTPHPSILIAKSFMAHLVFGIGLYATAVAANKIGLVSGH
ncbi:DUF2938 family protein [Roseiconus lacunae]|uniref:DUF2938 family protein n=1 Tax=Roseiconus lacunae TaxID=2605694 RepID=UPI0011F3586E|nr:DUF2938 family protein [Roseiconus lacunae]